MDKIKKWLKKTPYKDFEISIASCDASFRKYYRLKNNQDSFLLMDSSLEMESLTPFLDVTSKLLSKGINAPSILEQNLDDGFLILEDFGNTHYLDVLNKENFQTLYKKAINEIIKMQSVDASNLPIYDKEFLCFEMNLMQEWYLEKKLKLSLSPNQKEMIKNSIDSISEVILTQPQNIFVHRDFHSRNIMLTANNEIGIIDYQDAMSGAITYDLVSLLKDCYINFEKEKIDELALYLKDKSNLDVDDKTFLKWFDFMGMQRHIKVLGVFSRLHIRDNKDGYLKDIPLTLKYAIEATSRYDETKELSTFLKELI
jgi:aminoglycoside/choline kinase family phosphotransferase